MKKLTKIVMLVSLMLCILATPAFAGEYAEYGYQHLNEEQQKVYVLMRDTIARKDRTISLTKAGVSVTVDELIEAKDFLYADHPELFWFNNWIGYTHSNGKAATVAFNYEMTKDEIEQAQEKLENKVKNIIRSIPADATTDDEKALFLHDYLACNVKYNEIGLHQTAYGAIVDNNAVCAGYARAYQLLLQQVGIDSWFVRGTALNASHAWNVVWLDGECVYTDVTWDNREDYTGIVWHAYYNRSLADISKDHFALDHIKAILPECNGHTNHNFFALAQSQSKGFMPELTESVSAEDFVSNMKVDINEEEGYRYHVIHFSSTQKVWNEWYNAHVSELQTLCGYNEWTYPKLWHYGNEHIVAFSEGNTPIYRSYTIELQTMPATQFSIANNMLDLHLDFVPGLYSGGIDLQTNTKGSYMVGFYGDNGQLIEFIMDDFCIDQDRHLHIIKEDCDISFSEIKVFFVDNNMTPLCSYASPKNIQ